MYNISQDLAHSKLFFWSLATWMTTWTEHKILGSQFSLIFLKYYSAFDISGLVKFSSVDQSRLTLCDPMDCSKPGLTVHQQFPEFTQTHVHWVGDAIQPSHPLSSPSPPAFKLSQNQCLFKWVSSSHQVAKILEFQLQHQSFQWTPRTDFL